MAEPQHSRQRPAALGDERRTRLIRAVRAACRRQSIDDDDRKSLQQQIIGKASMSDMTFAELGRLLDHLNKGQGGPSDHRPHLGKVKALWWTLYWLGEVDDYSERALSAYVRRMTGLSALRFLDHGKAATVIESMKAWAARLGVEWPSEEKTRFIAERSPNFSAALHERHAVVDRLEMMLVQGGELVSPSGAYLRAALGLCPNQWLWTAQELDEGIRILGRKVRKMKGRG